MKCSILFAAVLVAASAEAAPDRTQVGELCEIVFSASSAKLPRGTSEALGDAIAWARDNPDGLVVLDGHADRSGEAPREAELSLERAKAVRDELVAGGVNPHQIVVAAYGSEGPQRPNHAGNRRVTVWGTQHDLEAQR